MKVNIKITKRTKRKKRDNPSYFLFYLAFLFLVYFLLAFLPKGNSLAQPEDTPDKTQEEVQNKPPPPPLVKHRISIKRGYSLSDILLEHDFTPQEIHKLKEDVKPIYDIAKIKAGNELRLCYEKDGPLKFIEYDIDQKQYLKICKNKDCYEAEIVAFPIETKIKVMWGTIDQNLIQTVHEAGEQDFLAIAIADIFAWDIDFYYEIRKNDTFKLIFEKKYLDGEFIGYGNILAAQFTNQGNTFQAIRFTYPDTQEWDYFTPEGKSLRKEFLKSPINGARITSRFSHSRLHPVWKVYRPHFGVDYGAPIGTPVQATADGTVTFVGLNGGAGRMVKIRHKNFYETMYLHLRGYARGIRKSVKVTSGQTVGYVGSSGTSTGPHLDYRIKYHGKYINPLAHKFKPVAPLREKFTSEFQDVVDCYQFGLNAPLYVFSGFRTSPLFLTHTASNR
ncbi:MAG: peptidoglycan DD-metalloendopeptidase family protein [Candidatus Aminicenantes bacterium]|nr:peptidoglycan DD-metalloendopeptidase family protein [Candidatus Aminicenantes bacterium]